ncbi:DUF1631 domain-containing protein [Marinobacter litoralis]|uniref:DUF1631 domain-containing protein n=1 Tax=Marinobacter litoralis TaxID=187981 RepID=UPI0018ED5EEF|nr:DUF1631 domain-containing protein [Marinobacter litoralis]MBJ6138180.1 DUF1631 domain-containing protein [Marinobacter litoralis]
MAQHSKVVHLGGQTSVGKFSLPLALVRLRDSSGQSLQTVLAGFFEKADDSLFALADRAGSNQDQASYFDAMRELRLRRKAMTVSILQYVSQSFNELGRFHPGQKGQSLEHVDVDSLSLVDHGDLEQQVALDNLINRLRNRYAEVLSLLAARVRHSVPDLSLTDAQIPLSPEVLGGAISEACADLDIDIRAKLVVLKLFERMLTEQLGAFYQACNQTLVTQGVLTEMTTPPRAGSSIPRAVPTSDSTRHSGGSNLASHDKEAEVTPTLSELSALLHQTDHQEAPAEKAVGQVLETERLITQLSQLQSATQTARNEQVLPLRDQLKPLLQSVEGEKASVGQVDGDVINLVSMLFEFILEDRQLHPVMKALIGRLQIPVLKVALCDRNFFNRGGHPVRKLLNELALAAIGWSEKRAGVRDPLRDKIEEVVERVLSEYSENVGLFEELVKDFGHFMDLDRRRRELVEQRLRDAEEGRARQERAQQAAAELIRQQTEAHELPQPVSQIVHDPLSRYLQWVLLRHGEETHEWASARALTERLVWSVDPHPVSSDTRSDLLRAIPDVVEGLRKALQEISWDPFATDAVIRDLELVHVDVLQNLVTAPIEPGDSKEDAPEHSDIAFDENAEAEPPLLEPEELKDEGKEPGSDQGDDGNGGAVEIVDQAAAQSEKDVADQRWLDTADQLSVGSWLELNRDGVRVRCKLAAFIKATDKYIFVNRNGAKVAEYLRDDLALAMQKDEITLLDDGLIFDRALESIIDNLRQSRKD